MQSLVLRMKQIYQEEVELLKKNLKILEGIINQQNTKIEELETENRELNIIINENKIIFEDIEDKYKKLLSVGVLSGDKEGIKETRNTINKLVREIDTCIALLNE